MATLQVTIPDDLKTQFEHTFAGQDLDILIGQMMRDALEQAQADRRERRTLAIAELLALRGQTPPASVEAIREARELGRQ